MNRNTSLVPTVITDVNGKITTVHKKPATSSSLTFRVPAPVSGRQELIRKTALLAHAASRNVRTGMIIDTQPRAIIDALGKVDDDTINAIGNYLKAYPEDPTVLHVLKELYQNEDGARIQNYFFAREVVGDNSELSFYEVTSISCGVAKVLNAPTGFQGASDEMLQQATALVKVTGAMYMTLPSDETDRYVRERTNSKGSETIEMVDPELISVITDNADRDDDICRFIEDRGTADPALIRDYIADGTALAEGML